MLTVIADALRVATRTEARTEDWAAPDHWRHHHTRRNQAELERQAAEQRAKSYRVTGLW
ncbi:hypothetical protein [Actibacterium sp. 188UL27-1]|uniref:hypothetical protein n=1 Tax=Actibacterium sp. 188UL27-1 TaxID=2786961 RepID=UPI00195C55A6|nr:hypothetical protein [Actibacterium sp. 188UL27-1]MBM7070232.1 hypothetical protein [Actibacterium sp. 188UL27-1]